jgi:hypothetical protein
VARLLGDGRRDRGFGSSTGAVFPHVRWAGSMGTSVGLQRGHATVLAIGTSKGVDVLRLRSSGQPDRKFGSNGHAFLGVHRGLRTIEAASLPDGGVMVAGDSLRLDPANEGMEQLVLGRLDSRGRPDTTFGNGGVFVPGYGNSSTAMTLCIQRDGRLLVGGGIRQQRYVEYRMIARLLLSPTRSAP